MNGRKLNWTNAKWDGLKGQLTPTGEDIDHFEEAKLQEWHDAKKGVLPYREPSERDKDTLDNPAHAGEMSLLDSVLTQVALRAQIKAKTERIISASQAESRLPPEVRLEKRRKRRKARYGKKRGP